MKFDSFTYTNGDIDVFVFENGKWKPWVLVRPSAILSNFAGNERGVFAAQNMRKDTVIGRYVGRLLGRSGDSATEAYVRELEESGQGDYLITIEGLFVDGNRPTQVEQEQIAIAGRVLFPQEDWSYPGAYIHLLNDGRNTPYENNVAVNPDGRATLTRDVPAYPASPEASVDEKADSELRWFYGPSFWSRKEKEAATDRRKRQSADRSQRAAKRLRMKSNA
jgi:hypothetical protein